MEGQVTTESGWIRSTGSQEWKQTETPCTQAAGAIGARAGGARAPLCGQPAKPICRTAHAPTHHSPLTFAAHPSLRCASAFPGRWRQAPSRQTRHAGHHWLLQTLCCPALADSKPPCSAGSRGSHCQMPPPRPAGLPNAPLCPARCE